MRNYLLITCLKGNMGFKSISLTAITLVLSTNLSAALVGINDVQMAFLGTPEDGFNITRDTSTGIEWLDWSLTLNRSYNDVFSQTQGGNLAGWRYAMASEFASLAVAAGIPVTFFDNIPGGTNSGFEVLNTFLGSGSTTNESAALSGESFSAGTHAVGGFNQFQEFYEIPDSSRFNYVALFSDSSRGTRVGSALVREVSAVPVPAAVWLFASGLLGLVGVARRKKL